MNIFVANTEDKAILNLQVNGGLILATNYPKVLRVKFDGVFKSYTHVTDI